MRLINISADKICRHKTPLCACIGYFDGMHKGHQALIEETIRMAGEHNCESALITFDPDPWVTIKGIDHIRHITTMRQRINLAVDFGIQNIVILKFTKQMSEKTPTEFVTEILGQLNLSGIVCGFDFRYGYKGAGDCEMLKKEAPYDVRVVDAVSDEIGKISSTRISECIEKGDMPAANAMLGYEFQIDGTVIHGRHIGTGMGFPTANVAYSGEYILPRRGVYACYVKTGKQRYRAMVNIGHNPTVNYTDRMSLEAHIIGFEGNLYGKMITVSFIRFLRPEMKFRNADNLVMQLDQDLRDTRKILDAYEQSLSCPNETASGQ